MYFRCALCTFPRVHSFTSLFNNTHGPKSGLNPPIPVIRTKAYSIHRVYLKAPTQRAPVGSTEHIPPPRRYMSTAAQPKFNPDPPELGNVD